MRHTAHLMLGVNATRALSDLKRYMVRYGSGDENRYFSALLYHTSDEGLVFETAVRKSLDENVFVSGQEDTENIVIIEDSVIPADKKKSYLESYFERLYNKSVTINDPGDSDEMKLCVYLPMYDMGVWELLDDVLKSVDSIPQKYSVDVMLLPYDLAMLFDEDERTLPERMDSYKSNTRKCFDWIKHLVDYKSLGNFVMLQNANTSGCSLGLDNESFSRIIGEYALLMISHYNEMYSPSMQDNNRPIHALGLSVVTLDRYYFVQYLLHRAYSYMLERVNIRQEYVDVNKVSNIADGLLRDNIHLFSNFYTKKIEPLLNDGVSHETIVSQISPDLNAEIDRLTNEFQSYIYNDNLSLPEKEATLAQLLGEDNQHLIGYVFNKDQLVLEDCGREVMDLFINANNKLASAADFGDDILDDETDEIELCLAKGLGKYTVLSDKKNSQVPTSASLLDAIKDLKVKMLGSSNYIRQKTKELQNINEQIHDIEESEKRLTKDGFVFNGQLYHLLSDIKELPCEEDYIPVDNKRESVDLRQNFTPVKNQGKQGSCTAFATVSVFEHILKKNKKQKSLSESFVYYNARKRSGRQDADDGVSILDALNSMSEEGVCTSELCKYDEGIFDQQPSDEAYTEASTRKVVKALNVKINLIDIKSALSQGYPVIISLKIFDSFKTDTGFINRPSDSEIKSDEAGNHAMVICGYSDTEKVFIVRNSWGDAFGVDGYCYIPYSYISDPSLLNVACIITKVNDSSLTVLGVDAKKTLSFDMNNSRLKAAILKNLIDEENLSLESSEKQLNDLNLKYNILFQKLGNNINRTKLCDGTLDRLELERKRLKREEDIMRKKRDEALKEFDEKTKMYKSSYIIAIIACSALTVISVFCYFMNFWGDVFKYSSLSLFIALLVVLLISYLLKRNRKTKRFCLDEEYKEKINELELQISKKERESMVLHLKMHVAGMILDSLATLYHNLHSKYNGMRSFVGNLKIWYDEEKEIVNKQVIDIKPFISLLSNKCLDDYFDKNKDIITNGLNLCSMFRSEYEISEDKISAFKNNLKKNLISLLYNKLDDILAGKILNGDSNYPYVKNSDIEGYLKEMESKSMPFVTINSVATSKESLNTHCRLLFVQKCTSEEQKKYECMCRNCYENPPSVVNFESKNKIVMLQLYGISYDEIMVASE